MNNPYAPPKSERRTLEDLPSFQVVGRTCEVCTKRVSTTADGVGCVACQVAYHLHCLANPDHCARGNHSLSVALRDATERVATVRSAALRRGRTFIWFIVSAFLSIEVLLTVLHVTSHRGSLVTDVVRVVSGALLIWRALAGNGLARRVIVALTGAGIPVALIALVLHHDVLSRLVAVLAAVLVGAGCWVFGASSAAREYIDARAPRARDGAPPDVPPAARSRP